MLVNILLVNELFKNSYNKIISGEKVFRERITDFIELLITSFVSYRCKKNKDIFYLNYLVNYQSKDRIHILKNNKNNNKIILKFTNKKTIFYYL